MNENEKPKIIVAHPGKQHSFQLAVALEKEGMLYKYITTVYDKPGSITKKLKSLLKGKDLRKASGRSCDLIPDEKIIQFCELGGLILLLLIRLPNLFRWDFKWCLFLNDWFSKKVAKYALAHDVDAVIMFDTAAESGFRILKTQNPNIRRIMDVSIATRQFMKSNFERDTGIDGLKREYGEFWNEHIMRGYKNEIDLSEYFLAASSMSKRSLEFCGVAKNKIAVVPYGVDATQFNFDEKKTIDGPLKIIYVGQVTYRKGIHHLLGVIDEFDENKVEISLAGDYSSKSELYLKYKDKKNIRFLGFVTRDVLAAEYQKADVFTFATIGEGYGLVVLESLSCGVPVICSNLAGGDDAIINGINGFVYEGGNNTELYEKIQWCMDHREELQKMRFNARKIAESYTWEHYHKSVVKSISKMLQNAILE